MSSYGLHPRRKKKKVDNISKPCYFLGYTPNQKGYRLYDPESREIKRYRDVKFFENIMYKDSLKIEHKPPI